MTLPCITVRQPWARCIAVGEKLVENRGKTTSHRGLIAIHAGKTPDPLGDQDPRVLRLFGEDPRLSASVGAIVAVATLVGCHQASPIWPTCCAPWGEVLHYGPSGKSRPAHHLVLADVVRLDRPVPVRGQVRVPWSAPAEVEAAVRAQLAEAGVR